MSAFTRLALPIEWPRRAAFARAGQCRKPRAAGGRRPVAHHRHSAASSASDAAVVEAILPPCRVRRARLRKNTTDTRRPARTARRSATASSHGAMSGESRLDAAAQLPGSFGVGLGIRRRTTKPPNLVLGEIRSNGGQLPARGPPRRRADAAADLLFGREMLETRRRSASLRRQLPRSRQQHALVELVRIQVLLQQPQHAARQARGRTSARRRRRCR